MDTTRAQVFQNSVCNWRCWYCYVPFSMLKGDPGRSELIPVVDMVDWYLSETSRPPILDLSGGQPDLTPEWVPWTMEALKASGAVDDVYLWSDDNLSNDFAFRYLTDDDWDTLTSYRGYGRVGCFKGVDEESFSFNTAADPAGYKTQFDIFRRLHVTGIDLYAYVTFTCPPPERPDPVGTIRAFIDQLSEIDEDLPTRTVPLEIQVFTPTAPRVRNQQEAALRYQHQLVDAWVAELDARYGAAPRSELS